MPSPFPGMDPYLEHPAHWGEFHAKFINYWQEAIADVLPDEYEAGLAEKVYLVEYDPETRKLVYPDIAVAQEGERAAPTRQASGAAVLEPVTVPLILLDGPREGYIEIIQRSDRNLVAVLELLSPANKENPGRLEYLSKRNALLHQNVHVVELDLLVGGKRLPMGKPLPAGDYYYLVSRAEERPSCQVYAWELSRALPHLPVPLKPQDGDVWVDLGQVFATTYERGRYLRRVAYEKPCPAPLSPAKKAWSEDVEAAWRHELATRMEEMRSGEVKGLSWEQARKEILDDSQHDAVD